MILNEIHRFNRSQQDALLPDVKRGLVHTKVGLTTENPFFYVNSALTSRAQVFEFKPLSEPALEKVLANTLQNTERGLGNKKIQLDPDARAHLIAQSNGDARRLLNALELAALTTTPDSEGLIHITLSVAEECVQKRSLVYDKGGDQHYDIASAFIKSLRGGDPDAALYWMSRMLKAGDDPRFIARRLIISAAGRRGQRRSPGTPYGARRPVGGGIRRDAGRPHSFGASRHLYCFRTEIERRLSRDR